MNHANSTKPFYVYEDPISNEQFQKAKLLANCHLDKEQLRAENVAIIRAVREREAKLPPLPNIDQIPNIPEFYAGTSIFITGGTGFMGKALIEKLLYSCPDVKTIYLLMRSKKGVAPEERLKPFFDDPVFVRLRSSRPNFLEKIVLIKGDCAERYLGISEEDRKMLIENVDIVFHVAASVRFDDSLKKAVLMNTRGTYYAVELAKQLPKLKVFLHVSTSYCNTDQKVIEEKLYPPKADWRSLIRMVEKMDERTLMILQPKILDHFPNTYTFTKSLSENIIEEAQTVIPIVVFRPSIVISSHSEPVPGWIDNLNGPMGLIVGTGTGCLRVLLGKLDIVPDWLEVDMGTNSMLTSAWYQAHREPERKKECFVVNACTSNLKQVSYYDLVSNCLRLAWIYPFDQVMWYPFIIDTSSPRLYWVLFILLHLIPGMFCDLILKLKGQKLSLLRIYRKAYFSNVALKYFMVNEWVFRNGNFINLSLVQKEEDRKIFEIDFKDHDTLDIMRTDLFGLKKFILKESDNYDVTIPKAKSRMKKLYLLHCFVIFVGCFTILYTLWRNRFFLKNRFVDSVSFEFNKF